MHPHYAPQVTFVNASKGKMALKKTQGFFDVFPRPLKTEGHGRVVLEVGDWIDGMNHSGE